jgi:hypothetical protein
MTSEVEICNLALSHIRAGSINSLTESSVQAQQCKLKYPILRDQMLQDAPWQFNRSIKALAVLTDTLFNWIYVYQYPTDCLYVNRLILDFAEVSSDTTTSAISSRYYDRGLPRPDLDRQVEHKIYNIDGNRVIASNECNLRIDYRKRVEDPNLFNVNFIMGLSHMLAAELSIPLVGIDKGRALRSDELKIYQSYVDSGIENELNEQFTHIPDSDFINIR